MLSLIEQKYDSKDIEPCRDDDLRVFTNTSGPGLEKVKKFIRTIFIEKMLDIIVECNMKILNYLDLYVYLQCRR